MNEFLNVANKEIINTINELNKDAKVIMDKVSEEEKGKITLTLLYFKIVLQGCMKFGTDISGYVKAISDCSIDESDIALVLDKYCGEPSLSISIGDIELDDNPPISLEVSDIKGPNDIEFFENPPINLDIEDVKNENDIELDENPYLDIDVQEVFNELDIVLDENPPINIEVEDVKNENDIEFDEDPPINIEVEKIPGENSIELDENPPINMDVAEVIGVKDIKLDEEIKTKKNSGAKTNDKASPLFGNLSFEVQEVSEYVFDAEEFERQLREERSAKRAEREQKKSEN